MDEHGSIPALLASLTVEQKAALCLGSDFWHTAPVESAGIESIMVADGPHGLRKQPERGDHVAISGSVPATCFPTASALGSSWDPALAHQIGTALGTEARAQNLAVVLGPGINIKRSPLCGRNFEYLSEDPYLAGRMAAPMVDGLQSQQVGASLKHFAVNNQETDRLRVSADVDERTLREIYLPAFEHVVTTTQPWTVMCAYNKVNGEFASQHHWLLTEVLRGEWGFGGLVVSDWGAVHDRVAALVAGLELEMPPNLGVSDKAIVDAVAGGTLDEAVLDQAVARVLHLVLRSRERTPATVDADVQHALARRAASESMVLLKNAGDVLPLQDRAGLVVAVVGEFARVPRFQGAGSSQVNPTRVDIPLEELTAALPSATVRFAPGFSIDAGAVDPRVAAASGAGLAAVAGAGASNGSDPGLAAQAVAAADGADVIVVCLGLPAADESEGFDRTHIDLPSAQTDLLTELAATYPGTPLVAVLFNGSVVRTSSWDHAASAVVECWLAGQAAGGALADILTGAVNPSGRLAETIPLRLEDNPSYLNFLGEEGHVRYGEGIFVGYRGYDAADLPVAYPFGHGLSYTTFEYSALSVSTSGSLDGGDLAVTVEASVTNTGTRPGQEVAQLYVSNAGTPVARPPRELKGFAKLSLAPGETGQAVFSLTSRDLAYWSRQHQDWVVQPGPFELAVGASSRDLRLAEVLTVTGTPRRGQLTALSTLQEWLADPVGGEALRREVGTRPDGRPAGILGSEELIAVIGNFPLHTLTAFPGLGVTRKVLRKLTSPITGVTKGQ